MANIKSLATEEGYVTTIDNLMALVTLDIKLITGSRQASDEARQKLGIHLPKELFGGGVIKMFNPKSMKSMRNVRTTTEALLHGIGIKFMGGYAVPIESLKTIKPKLSKLMAEGNTSKVEFLSGFQSAVEEQIKQHPRYKELIQKLAYSPEQVASKINFSWCAIKVAPVDEEDAANLPGSISELLFLEIAEQAKAFAKQSLDGRNEVTRRALRPLRHMADKMDGMSMLNPLIVPLVSTIREVVSALEVKSPITDQDLMTLRGITSMLSDKEEMKKYSLNVRNGKDSNKRFSIQNKVTEPDMFSSFENEEIDSIPTSFSTFDDFPELVFDTALPDNTKEEMSYQQRPQTTENVTYL